MFTIIVQSLHTCIGMFGSLFANKMASSLQFYMNVKQQKILTMKKKDNKQCLLDNPCTVMVRTENNCQEYKGPMDTKWLRLTSKNIFFLS